MEGVKGYDKFNQATKAMFSMIRKNHIVSMGEEEKEKHSIENLKSVKINQKEKCFEVQYKHAWYKYYPDGTWG